MFSDITRQAFFYAGRVIYFCKRFCFRDWRNGKITVFLLDYKADQQLTSYENHCYFTFSEIGCELAKIIVPIAQNHQNCLENHCVSSLKSKGEKN